MRYPSDERAHATLRQAENLKMDGNYTEAIELLEQLLVSDPDNVVALEEVADNELSLEHYDRAFVAARRAATLDPASYTGHYILGFIASHREDWKLSIEELQLANRFKTNNPEILRCLGWSLFNDGQIMQGVVTLERALNLEGGNPLTLCDLGVVYLRLKNYTKAKALFQRTLDIDPGNPRAVECLEMAERIERATRSLETK